MRISFAATNPCHLFPFAREFHAAGHLGTYFSGYPRWKLDVPGGMNIRAFPLRTLATYALLRLPHSVRPKNRNLFRWQDNYFDHKTARALEDCDAVHGIPGQCREIFRQARELGIITVLNHATGPARLLAELIRPEYERVRRQLDRETVYDADYLAREQDEYELADFHCVASSVVQKQLVEFSGIPADRIWIAPYAADQTVFHPTEKRKSNDRFQIVFAGQLSLRKGIGCLLDAMAQIDDGEIDLHLYGSSLPETELDLNAYQAKPRLHRHGAVSQNTLAEAFRSADVLVLPSIEEGFGLVVPQALNCGLPCIVSDAVGASDLVRHRENGSIFPTQNSADLATELVHWQRHPRALNESHSWRDAAETLISLHHQHAP